MHADGKAGDAVPPIRMDLDFIPVDNEGQRVVVVRDPLGIVPRGVAVPEPVFALMALMNGSRSARDILAEGARIQGGEGKGPGLDEESLNAMVAELDQAGLLASDRFRAAYAALREEYGTLTERPMILAGQSYPAQGAAFSLWVEECLEKGAGDVPGQELGSVKAVVAPHLEPSVCAGAYGSAYGVLRGRKPERVLVLGIGHAMGDAMFSVSNKHYDTPLGPLRSDGEWGERLRSSLPGIISGDSFDHRSEHSIELQAVFLKQMFKGGDMAMVPMLCGPLTLLRDHGREGYLRVAGPLLEQLRELAAMDSTLVVAGVDLSHIGPKFGHKETGRDLEAGAREHEELLLGACLRRDADGLWQEMARVGDRYNVCGFAALACLLEILPPCTGRTLTHAIWHETATNSAVSYASMAFGC